MAARRRKLKRSPQLLGQHNLMHLTYEITEEPIVDAYFKQLPDEVKGAIERLNREVQTHPRQVIPELLQWIEQYPRVLQFQNYLSVAYMVAGETEKAEETILQNYQRNPDYLFARLNYADLCLKKRDYAKIAELFEYKFDLKLLYPNRNRFHISEYTSFMGTLGVYYVAIGERDKAQQVYEMLNKVAPDHLLTHRLNCKLHPSRLRQALARLRGWLE